MENPLPEMENLRKSTVEKFIAENVREHIDMPQEILAKVQSVINEVTAVIEVIKISMALSNIFEDWQTVCDLLKDTPFAELGKLLENCVLKLKKSKEIIKCPSQTDVNQDIIQVIDAFQRNWKVMEILGDDYLDISWEDLNLLNAINTLLLVAKQRMFKDPRAELILEKNLHKLYHENRLLMEDIEKFQAKIMRSKNNLRWRIASKEGIVASIEQQLEDERQVRGQLFQTEQRGADKRFKTTQVSNSNRRKEVEEEMERAEESLAKTMKQNFATEADVRAERNKLLIQLQTLTRRYDTGLSERFKTNLVLDKQLAEMQREFDNFFYEIYTPEEEIYSAIVKAAELKKLREFERKLADFVGNRNARIIQKAWKRYIKIVRKERAEEQKAKGKGKK